MTSQTKPDPRYDAARRESHWRQMWDEEGTYRFDPDGAGEVFSIDTPPPTVSGRLHMGHVYSYCHADFIARYRRMRGFRVFYPMGFDDNGLPTEHLVARAQGRKVAEMEPEALVRACLAAGEAAQKEYRELWQRLGLSVDWGLTYRTIGAKAQRWAQWSFADLWQKDLVYRAAAPSLWCTHCQTAIAQAEVEESQHETVFYALAFVAADGASLEVATTRPELLPACRAVFVHPGDGRYAAWVGRRVRVPLGDAEVPVLADEDADPDKGTGAVMCCTFGDQADVDWWRRHRLEAVPCVGSDGRLGAVAGKYAGLEVEKGRQRMVEALAAAELLRGRRPAAQSRRVHERCGTPVEFVMAPQWFIRVLDHKEALLQAGRQVVWRPGHMRRQYEQWVANLRWDWCISRQRPFGVSFPVWHCGGCGRVEVAAAQRLPLDPRHSLPDGACPCGGSWRAETDVMDTWATSSLTPALLGEALGEAPMSMRPLAHEIIRSWAFYSLVKAHHHWGRPLWKELVVSGWGLAPKGGGKISKSRGGGPLAPAAAIEAHAADAVRYWAASTGLGKDAQISTERIKAGRKLLTKLWNLARFSAGFLQGYAPPLVPPPLNPADAWILSRLQRVIDGATQSMDACEYALARAEIEAFFWREVTDNYLEMAKKRFYEAQAADRAGALYALHMVLAALVRLWAPFLPFVTEEIQRTLWGAGSVHLSRWPVADPRLVDAAAERLGRDLVEAAGLVRRFKSERGLPLGKALEQVRLWYEGPSPVDWHKAAADLAGVTRARHVVLGGSGDPAEVELAGAEGVRVGVLAAGFRL